MENYIVAIDLGTSSTRVVAGVCNGQEPYSLSSVTYEIMESRGMLRGSVANRDEVSKVLNNVLLGVAKKVGGAKNRKDSAKIFSHVGVNVGGLNYSTTPVKKEVRLGNEKVTVRTIERVESLMREEKEGNMIDDKIIGFTSTGYSIDNEPFNDAVVDRSGSTLEAVYLCVSAKRSALSGISDAFPAVARPTDFFVSAMAKAQVLLTPAQRRDGVALVDLGKGGIGIAVYYRDVPVYAVSIPLGVDTITKDLAQGLCISEKDAEAVKINFGIMDESDARTKKYSVKLPSGESIQIDGKATNFYMRSRLEELGAYIYTAISEAQRRGAPKDLKVALTGGGSKLKGCAKVLEKQLGLSLTQTICPLAAGIPAEKVDEMAGALGMASMMSRDLLKAKAQEQSATPTLQFENDNDNAPQAPEEPQKPAEVKPEPEPKTNEPETAQVEKRGHGILGKLGKLGDFISNQMSDDFNTKE